MICEKWLSEMSALDLEPSIEILRFRGIAQFLDLVKAMWMATDYKIEKLFSGY